jgi:hypothetical protein
MTTNRAETTVQKKGPGIKSVREYERASQEYRESLLESRSKSDQLELAILDSGIFWRGMLKGKALSGGSRRNPKYQLYSLHSPGTIYTLVRELAAECLGDDIDEALGDFFVALEAVAKTALYAGVPQKQVEKVKQLWGDKVTKKFENDGTPGWWYDRRGPEDRSLPLYARLCFIIVNRLHEEAPKVPTVRIASWINTILFAVAEEPMADRTLRDYIKRNRETWEKHERPLFGPGTFF